MAGRIQQTSFESRSSEGGGARWGMGSTQTMSQDMLEDQLINSTRTCITFTQNFSERQNL